MTLHSVTVLLYMVDSSRQEEKGGINRVGNHEF